MTSRQFGRIAVVAIVCLALCCNANADTLQSNANHILIGIVAAVAVVVVVAVVIIHETTKKKTVTGCVVPAQNGMVVTDEKDKRVYTLSGDTAGVKPGERMALQGKTIKPTGGKPLAWETKAVAKDLGHCQP